MSASSAPPVPALDNTMGALYVAAIVGTALWGAATVQAYNYYNNYRKDFWGLKLFVATVWILDTMHLSLIVIEPYYRLIKHYGDPSFLLTKTTPITVEYQYVLISGFVCLMVQCFYVHRIWLFSKKNLYLTGFLITLVLAEFSLNTALYAKVMPLTSVLGFDNLASFIEGTSALDAAVGLVIAFSMIFFLQRSRTGFSRTDSMINRLMIFTINTGLLSNMLATLCFIFDLVQPDSDIHIAFFLCVSKLYTNSLLATLNARYGGQPRSAESSEATASGQSFSRALAFQARYKEKPTISIQINTDTLTMIDEKKADQESFATESQTTIEFAENRLSV